MAYCRNCGHEIPENAKFCLNCGTPVEQSNIDNIARSNVISSVSYNVTDKKGDNGDKKPGGGIWPILVFFAAMLSYYSEVPIVTVMLTFVVFGGAYICLKRKFRLKALTVISLLIGLSCLLTAVEKGEKFGYTTSIPKQTDYQKVASTLTETKESTPVKEKEEKPKKTAAPAKESKAEEKTEESKSASSEQAVEQPDTTKKPEATAEPKPSKEPEATKEPENPKTPGGVDPELKAFLDSYEAYMDEYIAFMTTYMENPGNALSMLSEYGKIMERYEDFAEKIDKYDSDTMSPADEKYYLEVINRVNMKMLNALY